MGNNRLMDVTQIALTWVRWPNGGATLREEYHAVLKQYRTLLNNKRNEYYKNKISELEDTTLNSDKKHFWNCLKSIDDSVKQKVTPEISE